MREGAAARGLTVETAKYLESRARVRRCAAVWVAGWSVGGAGRRAAIGFRARWLVGVHVFRSSSLFEFVAFTVVRFEFLGVQVVGSAVDVLVEPFASIMGRFEVGLERARVANGWGPFSAIFAIFCDFGRFAHVAHGNSLGSVGLVEGFVGLLAGFEVLDVAEDDIGEKSRQLPDAAYGSARCSVEARISREISSRAANWPCVSSVGLGRRQSACSRG